MKQRIIRILEYVGDEAWIQSCLDGRQIKEFHYVRPGCYIREAIIREPFVSVEDFEKADETVLEKLAKGETR